MANDFNISPDMINNIMEMLKSNNSDNTQNESNEKNASNVAQNINTNPNSDSTIDFETIMKIKNIMETLNNKDDPKSNLLYSLKPYLRKSKQDKLDQYANLLKVTQLSGLFNFGKGAPK